MTAIKIKRKLSSTTLDLPELAPFVGQRVELTVRTDADSRWPNGWFESIEGAITDETFERAPQPELDERPSLDS
jgi:hypothetical protein